MKFLLFAAVIAARWAAAQDLSAIHPCGQLCITNMLAKAEELGCSTDDIACLCRNTDFGNGIRDCTNESCPADADKKSVLDTGAQYCAAALAQGSGGSVVATVSVTVASSRSNGGAVTTRAVRTVTSTEIPLSTATVLVANATDSAGNQITSTIGGLVAGGIAITTTDSRGTTFVTTATALPPVGGNSTGAAGNSTATGAGTNGTAVGVPVTTTNSLGSTIVTTTTPAPSSSGSPTTDEAGSTTGGGAAPSESSPSVAMRLSAAGFAGLFGLAAAVLL